MTYQFYFRNHILLSGKLQRTREFKMSSRPQPPSRGLHFVPTTEDVAGAPSYPLTLGLLVGLAFIFAQRFVPLRLPFCSYSTTQPESNPPCAITFSQKPSLTPQVLPRCPARDPPAVWTVRPNACPAEESGSPGP